MPAGGPEPRIDAPDATVGAVANAHRTPASSAAWLLRFGLAFVLLNTLLTFENRWPGFGVLVMPRLSFELCLAVAALTGWVAWRGRLSARAASLLAAGFVLLVVVRYADVTAPAVMGRPVNLWWDGRHAGELLRLAVQALPNWQLAAALSALVLAGLLLVALARRAILTLAHCLACPRPRPWLLAAVAALSASFAAYVPDVRDTRWFFSLPLAPTILNQGALLARVLRPGHGDAVLGASPAFDGSLAGLSGPHGQADVLLLFAESYGASTFDEPAQSATLSAPRAQLARSIGAGGRGVVSARVRSPTFGGSSWLAHAALLSGVDTTDPAHHDLLLASQRPTLVRHFARHGYRTVGWMPGIKRAWPEGAFYGFDSVADDAGIGYRGPDFGYWRIPDQAAMALLHAQELGREVQEPARELRERARELRERGPAAQELTRAAPQASRPPRFIVFPTASTHAPFHPLAPFVADWQRLTGAGAYSREQLDAALAAPLAMQRPQPDFLDSMRYQFEWLSDYLLHLAPHPLVLVIVGDHQAPALVSGRGASWDVPVHVISDDAALLRRLQASGFVPGLQPPPHTLTSMHGLTQVLLEAFDTPRPAESVDPSHPMGLSGLTSLPRTSAAGS